MTQLDYKFHLHRNIVSIKRKKKLVFTCNRVCLKEQMDSNPKQVGCVCKCYVRRGKNLGLMRKASSVKGVGGHFPLK